MVDPREAQGLNTLWIAPECPTIALTRDQIVQLQKTIGTVPDGFWGRKSIDAAERHLRALMPKQNPWPRHDDRSMRLFYGEPGTGIISLTVEGLGVEYMGKSVRTISCHEKIADSLHRILTAISQGPHASILKTYAGCYNKRKMRGGTRYSKHAWGAAIDLDAARNGNLTHWPTKATMPIEVMAEFAKEGWTSAGAFWGRDAMHHEAVRP